jgi:hypothetical protein
MSREDYIKLKQKLLKFNLFYCKLNNNLLRNKFKYSIFENYINIINGSLILIRFFNDIDFNFLILKNELNKSNINILCLYLNYKIYSLQQINNLYYLTYQQNIILLRHTLVSFLQKPCSSFITKN